MISFAENNMLDSLKFIWKECFKDSDEYIDFYFKNRFKANQTLVWLEKEVPVSMIFMLPSKIAVENDLIDSCYIYAVSTLEKYRDRGISTKLIEYANKINRCSFLVPAENRLFNFYEKRGYSPAFKIKESEFISKYSHNVSMSNLDAEDYKYMRDKRFLNDGYVEWDNEAVKYALDENRFLGGFLVGLQIKENFYGALCYKFKETLIIKEGTFDDEVFEECAAHIGYISDCKIVKAILSPYSNIRGYNKYFGMIYGRGIKNGYLNLALN